MNKLFLIFAIVNLIGCNESTNKEVNSHKSSEKVVEKTGDKIVNDNNDCPELSFTEKYSDKVLVNAKYLKCESDWKTNVMVMYEGKMIYEADKSTEFEFNESKWPKVITLKNNRMQVLLEINDRPDKNKILLLTFDQDKLIKEETIPEFEKSPEDIDSDTQLEFVDNLSYSDGLGDYMIYNPVLCYEINDGIRFDTSATIAMNKKTYGAFYGYKKEDSIRIPINK